MFSKHLLLFTFGVVFLITSSSADDHDQLLTYKPLIKKPLVENTPPKDPSHEKSKGLDQLFPPIFDFSPFDFPVGDVPFDFPIEDPPVGIPPEEETPIGIPQLEDPLPEDPPDQFPPVIPPDNDPPIVLPDPLIELPDEPPEYDPPPTDP